MNDSVKIAIKERLAVIEKSIEKYNVQLDEKVSLANQTADEIRALNNLIDELSKQQKELNSFK